LISRISTRDTPATPRGKNGRVSSVSLTVFLNRFLRPLPLGTTLCGPVAFVLQYLVIRVLLLGFSEPLLSSSSGLEDTLASALRSFSKQVLHKFPESVECHKGVSRVPHLTHSGLLPSGIGSLSGLDLQTVPKQRRVFLAILYLVRSRLSCRVYMRVHVPRRCLCRPVGRRMRLAEEQLSDTSGLDACAPSANRATSVPMSFHRRTRISSIRRTRPAVAIR